MYEIKPIKDIGIVNRSGEYVVVRLTGLLGDTIHASARFNYILNQYPNFPWIVIHTYPTPGRIAEKRVQLVVDNLMQYWFENERIEHYFFETSGQGGQEARHIKEIMDAVRYLKCQETFFDCVYHKTKVPDMSLPLLGINIPQEKDPLKAVILRYSGWHNHFMARNRPYGEWYRIERELLKYGYNISIVGIDDPHPNKNGLLDLRGKLTVREVLEHTKDASICICPATFLYVWNQFICPTFVLSDKKDVVALNRHWKLHENMMVINIHDKDYLNLLFREIKSIAMKR